MFGGANQKIMGACIIGVALIAGAYTVVHFGQYTPPTAAVAVSQAPTRVAVPVKDKDENGIEDWRDQFVPARPIILNQAATSTYTLPTTLTGMLGINLFQSIVRAKSFGPYGKSKEEVIASSVDAINEQTKDTFYGTRDIQVIEKWNEGDIKNYANLMAGIVINTNVKPKENEIDILSDIVTNGQTERMGELVAIASGYKSMIDQSLDAPVPAIFTKQHLDLINTYSAIQKDVAAMTLHDQDPALTLIRLKRYLDDAEGLKLALQNMNTSLQPYNHLFSANDPAVLFGNFDVNSQSAQ